MKIAAGRPATLPRIWPALLWTGCGQVEAAAGEMLHQAEKERQVARRHPAFIEGQDEIAAAGVDQEIGVLDPLGDALVGQEFAKIIAGEKSGQVLRGDIGVDGHGGSIRGFSARGRRAEEAGCLGIRD